MSQGSTSRTILLPVNVVTKICIPLVALVSVQTVRQFRLTK